MKKEKTGKETKFSVIKKKQNCKKEIKRQGL